jgi:hypothetical protein
MDQEPSTKARHDPKTKRISVETTIGVERIKFIAPREAWLQPLEILEFYPRYFDTLTFADVKPFLGRNKKESVQALAELAENYQAIFAQGFLNCVLAANGENPLFKPAKKQRGSVLPTGIDSWEVSKFALLLDTYLCYMEKFPVKQWPQYLINFYRPYYKLRDSYYANGLKAGEPRTKAFPSIVVWALEKHFGCKFTNDSFRTFVQKKRLTLKAIIPTPESDPTLKKFFDQFQE